MTMSSAAAANSPVENPTAANPSAPNPSAPNPSDGPDHATGLLLHEIFDAVAKRYPQRVAIEIPPGGSRADRHLTTYAELARHADSIAVNLRPLVAPDAIVAILLPRDSPDLYAAQLGVLKAGGAFTCIDPKFPDEHLRQVLDDAGAAALITDSPGRERAQKPGITLPPVVDATASHSSEDSETARRAQPTNLAYVIYTSGTTGAPKGVLVEHRSIVNLVLSDVDYFKLDCHDRVAQCSSPAYDSSIEETWLALSVGATLVLLDDDTVRLGPDLVAWLSGEKITVLCPPPTLLRTTGCSDPQRALPDLKLLYVGGEALPADLADRWGAGRWLENGYGPTECTVTVSRGRIYPGVPVTIGKPVNGCAAWILDESMNETADNAPGELCISGVALARGYHRRDQLTCEKFPTHPRLGRIFRTGDLVQRTAGGDLEYLGRIDGQVKLRGYRIELSAIEIHLAACAGVRAAGCRLQESGGGQMLVAHIVPQIWENPPSTDALREAVRHNLPAYMIPARFGFLAALPTTAGGKLDRAKLPDILHTGSRTDRDFIPPRTDEERAISDAIKRALKLPGEVSVEDDFFVDLGGDSLSVVGVLLELRGLNHGAALNVTARDVYEARTVARIAERLSATPASSPAPGMPREDATGHLAASEIARPILSTTLQSVWIAFELVLGSVVLYALTFDVLSGVLDHLGPLATLLLAPLAAVLGVFIYAPISVLIVALLKRVLIGRYQAMRAPVWGWFFTRHWIVTNSAHLIPWWFLQGTESMSIALRALGATVGRRVYIHRGVDLSRGGWDLLRLGDDATLGQDSALRLVDLEAGHLVIGPITIGAGATVETRAGVSAHGALAGGAHLTALSWLPGGVTIREGASWDGVPAGPLGQAPRRPAIDRGGELPPLLHGVLVLLGRAGSMVVPALPLIAFAIVLPLLIANPSGRVMEWIHSPGLSAVGIPVAGALAAISLAISLVLQGAAMRALGRVRPGVVSQWGWESIRIATKTSILESAGRWLSGSLFWPPWLRLAGMRIGPGCEISTIIDVLPETLTLGSECFLADGIYLCGPRRHRGTISIFATSLGRDTFLGNHAVIPAGADWPERLFVGVSTSPDAQKSRPGSAWFGHAAMELPRRDVVAADRRLTHNPGALRYATRLFWELMRLSLPALPIAVGAAWYVAMSAAAGHAVHLVMALLVAPILTAAAGVSLCLAIILVKWILLGRTRPGQHAFWSCWCGRWDFLYMAWEYWARGPLLALEQTLLLNVFLRLTGVRIGKRVVLGPGFSQMVDPDMLMFEDDATITCHFQAHSFEDRVLKMDYIRIGRGATAGDNAVIFYGAQIGEGATVLPHSVVMKNDVLQPRVRYAGCPTRPVS